MVKILKFQPSGASLYLIDVFEWIGGFVRQMTPHCVGRNPVKKTGFWNKLDQEYVNRMCVHTGRRKTNFPIGKLHFSQARCNGFKLKNNKSKNPSRENLTEKKRSKKNRSQLHQNRATYYIIY